MFSLSNLTQPEVMDYLSNCTNLDAVDRVAVSDGGSGGLLLAAAQKGYVDVIQKLADFGVDINHKKNDFGFSALAYSILKNHIDCAVLLIDLGASVKMAGLDPRYMVTIAIQVGSVGLFQRLISEGVNVQEPYQFEDFEKRTQLDVAVDCGSEEFADILINMGVDPSAGRGMGWLIQRAKDMNLKLIESKLRNYVKPDVILTAPPPPLRIARPPPKSQRTPERDEQSYDHAALERKRAEMLVEEFLKTASEEELAPLKWIEDAGSVLSYQERGGARDDNLFDDDENLDDKPKPRTYAAEGRNYRYSDILVTPPDEDAEEDFDRKMATEPTTTTGFIKPSSPKPVGQVPELATDASGAFRGEAGGIIKTPEVMRALKILGMDPEEEFTVDDISTQFRIMISVYENDPDAKMRLNIARDFIIGKMMDL
ncbi:hypothetical protein AAMO2058_000026200 [Amorphochlora amoebiformis]